MRSSISVAALALLTLSTSIQGHIIAGHDYAVLDPPQRQEAAGKIDALQSTGDVDRLDSQIFEDIHKNHVRLYDEQSIAAWVGKHGVNVAKFTAAFRSFGVDTAAGQAEQKALDYRISGVPTLTIAGKYTVVGDQAKMLSSSDQLIVMARAANQ